ncbi:SulA-like leucine-rich domain-containing protein [Zooshikella ganghwensis]|uniref:CDP-glycerol--UDP-pyrophosphoryl-N-acetylglucosaminyl-N-acetylmannosamine glycerophosphotransferase n=1 Tax=Zooshikella ganghwensis TaxID=202772 RepID=A0A4P9VKN2_9GAMM|nr:SulA-like leucine-rich domain-containing protein [Zooshikella ganghwensis]RDH43858.1 CDP-glycerol--UDP-pyrophosphoryl-N-acetylglucosaminyl-N-acetylmannosamine glycerophosphotransferase [Zooshikella ganghwensis]
MSIQVEARPILQRQHHKNSKRGRVSEFVFSGPEQLLASIIPSILADLNNDNTQRWLTIVCPPELKSLTIRWLQDSKLNRQTTLFLTATSEVSLLQLTLQALQMGKSHTVVCWLDYIDEHTVELLEGAAQRGNSQAINILQKIIV